MGYQALLFCLDEKLARVVTQVFSELDFTVEPVNEPFAAVKKLMAQRYDAIVVDCENEPNATLLFKSARNSGSNQNSLALALVEGQTGVAKAYRIGANLVLTKPINVEQAKGTLRVARGLLRKNLDAATPSSAAPAKVAPTPAAASFKPAIHNIEVAPSPEIFDVPELETAALAMAASAAVVDSPAAVPVPETRTKVLPEADSSQRVLPTSLFEATKPAAQPVPPAPFKNSAVSPASATGAASAPAPAREIHAPVENKPALTETVAPTFAAATLGSSPSFSALDDQDSGDSGGSKKILIVAAVVIVVAALGYFGWTKLSKTNSPTQTTINAPQPSQPVPASASAPSSSAPASVKPSGAVSEPAVSVAQPVVPQSGKPSVSTGTNTPVPTLAISPDTATVTTKKGAPPAIVVKSSSPGKNQVPREEAAPQVPNPLAIATPNDNKLSGLVASVPTTLPTATLATVKISQGVSQGLVIKRVQPRYPQNAMSMRIQGSVQLEATINKEGNISNLKVVSGDAVLARAASDAVRQWRYKPYYLNGEPVEIETQITVNFKLPN
jgi:TonB family protein